jgi:queuine tRNA-ribosyltransferase
MYSVVHGGVDRELRAHSIDFLSSLPFDGMAIGGSLGRDRAEMADLLGFLSPRLPPHLPVHLLGIADPDSVALGVPLGFDTFDSCFPTRVARHGSLLTRAGTLHIRATKHVADFGPIDPETPTIDCSRAYLHHLFRQKEPLYHTLASMHNVCYMNRLMASLRQKILADEI